MRHVRITGQNIKKLTSFKNQVKLNKSGTRNLIDDFQIGDILKELNKFDENDKTEAMSYIRNYISNDSNVACSSDSSKATRRKGTSAEKTNKYCKVQKKRYNLRCDKNRKIKYSDGNTVSLKKIIFKCKVCNASEKTKKLMLKHVQTHVGAPRSCIKCKRTFNGSVPFKWHQSNYCHPSFYDKWKFKCNLCPRVS
jgi:hypothetical protein